MAFRFFRRLRIAPGLSLNFSKSGLSLSAGPRGAKVTVGPRGVRNTVGLPGTGLHHTQHQGWNKKERRPRNTPAEQKQQAAPTPESVLTLSRMQRLFKSSEECALIDGALAALRGEDDEALAYLEHASSSFADAGFLGGALNFRRDDYRDAHHFLERAYDNRADLGKFFVNYGLDLSLMVHLTPELKVPVYPNETGVLLMLTEVYQHFGHLEGAEYCLQTLLKQSPDDLVVKLSAVEFFEQVYRGQKSAYKSIVALTDGVKNESAIHAALMLYKARALRGLGLPTAARQTLTDALRRKKDRPQDLLNNLAYERALVYEELGRKSQARKDLERIYALDPDFEDVARRLDLL